MENASKALLIAGAILIVLIIISIALILIFKSETMINVFSNNLTEEQKQAHNALFLEYSENITGNQLVDLISEVEANNANSKYKVELYINGSLVANAGTSISQIKINGSTRLYTVSSVIYNSEGIIEKIEIN